MTYFFSYGILSTFCSNYNTTMDFGHEGKAVITVTEDWYGMV